MSANSCHPWLAPASTEIAGRSGGISVVRSAADRERNRSQLGSETTRTACPRSASKLRAFNAKWTSDSARSPQYGRLLPLAVADWSERVRRPVRRAAHGAAPYGRGCIGEREVGCPGVLAAQTPRGLSMPDEPDPLVRALSVVNDDRPPGPGAMRPRQSIPRHRPVQRRESQWAQPARAARERRGGGRHAESAGRRFDRHRHRG